VRKLKAAAKRKTRVARIARSLKRTENAVRQKAFSLRLSLKVAETKPAEQPLERANGVPTRG
jgi:hypothetical protein